MAVAGRGDEVAGRAADEGSVVLDDEEEEAGLAVGIVFIGEGLSALRGWEL